MNTKTALISHLQAIDLELKSRKDRSIAKINAQAILDNMFIIVNSNKSDTYIMANKEKVSAVLKMAQQKINAI